MKVAHNHAFTLVELLAAIAVISVLVALILPVLSAARAAPQSSACISNLKQLYSACAMYSSDNSGYLPPHQNQIGVAIGSPVHYSVPERGKALVESLDPYTKSRQLWFCPADYLAGTESDIGLILHRFSSYKVDLFLGAGAVRGPTLLELPGADRGGAIRVLMTDTLWTPAPDVAKPPYSHNGAFNHLYYDGHVRSFPWERTPYF